MAEFYVNDIPLRRLNPMFQGFYSEVAYPYVVDGLNEIKVVVCPGPTPSSSQRGGPLIPESTDGGEGEDAPTAAEEGSGGDKQARICVIEYPVGVFAGDESQGQIWMEAEWQESREPQSDFPFVFQHSRDLDRQRGGWWWQKAEPLDLDRDMGDIQSAVARIHHAFEAGDGEGVANMARYYLEDMGRAIPAYGADRFKRDMVADINGNAGRKDWIRPIDWDEVDFRLCAEGCLVQILDKDWQPTIRATPQPDGEIYPFPIFLGRLDGRFEILL